METFFIYNVSFCNFARMMREKIIAQATELFIDIGFKSTTMDDIAEKMGISKKTIYVHFSTKTKLIQACTESLFQCISDNIDKIIAENHNAIDEILHIHKFVLKRLREEKLSVQYQLQKYYPKINASLRQMKQDRMKDCVIENLKKGMEQGLYRKDLQPDIVYRFYFTLLEGIRNSTYFPAEEYSIPVLVQNFLDYHIRGGASEKGLQYINNLAKTFQQ